MGFNLLTIGGPVALWVMSGTGFDKENKIHGMKRDGIFSQKSNAKCICTRGLMGCVLNTV